MSEDFCLTLWEEYKKLRNRKIAFDKAVNGKTIGEALAEIKLIGREVYEFYGLFGDRAVDLFLDPIQEKESLPKDLTEIGQLISDFIPSAFLYLEGKQFSRFVKEVSEIINKEIQKLKENLNLTPITELRTNQHAIQLRYRIAYLNFLKSYLNLQINFYQEQPTDFAENFDRHFSLIKSFHYNFNPARLFSLFANMKDIFKSKDLNYYTDKTEELKDFFDLEEFRTQIRNLNNSIFNFNYLKNLLSDVAFNKVGDLWPFFNAVDDEIFSSEAKHINQENLNYIQAIFINALNPKDTSQNNLMSYEKNFPKNFRENFIKYFIYLFKHLNWTSETLENRPDNAELKKDFYFFSGKIHELIFFFQKEGLLETLIEDLTYSNQDSLPVDQGEIFKIVKFIRLLSKNANQLSNIELNPPIDHKSDSPQTVLELLRFGKMNQDRLRRYKNE
jgi:hypothetical protein